MEQEHMIIIALLVVALYFLMMRKPCACPAPGQGFGLERFEGPSVVEGGAWIRNRSPISASKGGKLGLLTYKGDTGYNPNYRIRTDPDPTQGVGTLNHIQNRNHNMYQSQHVKHHLKADHRGKMMQNMMGRQDPLACPGGESIC